LTVSIVIPPSIAGAARARVAGRAKAVRGLAYMGARRHRRTENRTRGGNADRLFAKAAARHRVNDVAGALRLYEQILSADPDDARALNFAGSLAFMSGDRTTGLARLRRSIQLLPDEPGLLGNAGECLRMAGELSEAETVLRHSLALSPSNPDTLNFLGAVLLDRGAYDVAARAFADALVLSPGHAGAAFNLGALYMALKRPDLALPCYESILARAPKDADALIKKGEALQRLGRNDEAEACFEAALAHPEGLQTDPSLVVSLLCELYVRKQRISAVTDVYRRAIRHFPGVGGLKTSLAGWLLMNHMTQEARSLALSVLKTNPHDLLAAKIVARIDKGAGEREKARRRLEDIPKPLWNHSIYYEMASLMEAEGEFDRAFDHFAEANRMLGQQPQWQRLNPSKPKALVARVRNWSTPALLTGLDPRVPDDGLPTPIFLVGFNRSGTTLLENVLGATDAIVISDEKPFLESCFATYREMTGADAPDGMEAMSPDQIGVLRAAYWAAVDRQLGKPPRGNQRLLDKLPMNIIHLALLRRMFPDAPVLVLLRDPRDVIISNFRQNFGANNYNANFLTLEQTVGFYIDVMSLWTQSRQNLPGAWREVRYEDLVTDFEPTLKGVLAFLGLAWNDSYLSFQKKAGKRLIFTPSAADVVKPLYSNAVGRWQGYERQLSPYIEKLEPVAEALGYPMR
jgi:tetratricopeptide (TPR) repeat protein